MVAKGDEVVLVSVNDTKRKKILFLTFYFNPDLCAGSFRSTALVEELKKLNVDIHVITTKPNRYKNHKVEAPNQELYNNVHINRIDVGKHDSGIFDQIFSFFRFYVGAKKLIKDHNYDLIFATTSRLFTGYLAARISNQKNIDLYLDVRDIFSDTVNSLFNSWIYIFIRVIIDFIEKYTFNSAKIINIVSPGFKNYFNKNYKQKPLTFFTNGIDEVFINRFKEESQDVSKSLNKKLSILYAGNIGSGQDLHKIIPIISKKLVDEVEFKIIGGGGKKQKLIDEVNAQGCTNIEITDPIPQDQLAAEYMKADILFLNLAKKAAFEKVIPSKLFEYAATGKPIWAGLSGFPADFALSEIDNCTVFKAADPESAIIEFRKLKIRDTKREKFIKQYSRKHIIKSMSENIISCIDDK